MPPPPSVMQGAGVEQSNWQKLKMGMLMGSMVGCTIGFVFGSFSIITRGAGPNGALSQLSQTMLGSGATFGLFMGVGSVIRTEGQALEPAEMQAYRQFLAANSAEAVRSRLRLRFREERSIRA